MTANRENLVAKIRGLLNKTVDNGCTEEEALAALDKARAMMDAYEVTEDELKLTREEKAVLRSEPEGTRDPHGIKSLLAISVAEFADCRVWKGTHGLVFCGLQADAQMATWLLDTLAAFVQAELARHLMGSIAPRGERRFIINGFVGGCAKRISERLRDLVANSRKVEASNSRALVVVKGAAVAAKMAEIGIKLGKPRRSGRKINSESYAAGRAAGDRASFGRPIGGSGSKLLG